MMYAKTKRLRWKHIPETFNEFEAVGSLVGAIEVEEPVDPEIWGVGALAFGI